MVGILALGAWDWSIVAVYLAAMMLIGVVSGRRVGAADERSYVQANRSMPFWAVGLSMLATALGADDFIGTTQFGFAGDLALLGAFAVGYVGVVIVATLFLPKFYRSGALTIYGYLGERFGPNAQVGASAMFVVGGVVSAGVGLFVASFAVTPLFGEAAADFAITRQRVVLVLILIGVVGTTYTAIGGIRCVIWTDVAQMAMVFIGGGYAIWFLLDAIPLDAGQMVEHWRSATGAGGESEAVNKLRLFRGSGGVDDPYSPWTLPLWIVFFIGIFGTSHGYTQRLLTCRSAGRAGLGMVLGYTVGMASSLMFLITGLLAFLFNDPEVMGQTASSAGAFAASEEVYPRLAVDWFPAGLLGLALAAMIAAVMSSFDSSTAAIASSFIADVVRPLKRGAVGDGLADPGAEARPRPPWRATAVVGALLTASGVAAAWVYDPEDQLLVDFALGISSFPLGGMIGVFCAALFTRRGNSASVIAALVAGPIVWLFVQPELLDIATEPLFGVSITLASLTEVLFGAALELAWPWWFSIAAVVSFGVCCLGRPVAKTSCGR